LVERAGGFHFSEENKNLIIKLSVNEIDGFSRVGKGFTIQKECKQRPASP
jgi:hypothetical protein